MAPTHPLILGNPPDRAEMIEHLIRDHHVKHWAVWYDPIEQHRIDVGHGTARGRHTHRSRTNEPALTATIPTESVQDPSPAVTSPA